MCFHTSLTAKKEIIEKRFDANFSQFDVFEPYYHLSGFDEGFVYIIKQDEYNLIEPSYWGLLPPDYNIYQRKGFLKKTNSLNARAEGLFESPLFKKPIIENRCLIIADGFFEPHKRNNESFPHYIRYRDKSLFAFAGIYTELDDEVITASIITTLANPFFKEIHNSPNRLGEHRMPLVLDENQENDWLNPNLNKDDINDLLFSFTSKEFEAYPVTKDVMNSHKNSNNQNALEPVFYEQLNTLF